MLTEKLLDTGEVVLNYAEGETNGPPLLLLHGASLNWQSFASFIPKLEQHWHLYACDFRGHGKSGRPTSGFRNIDYMRDTTVFIGQLIDQPVVLIGFSLGAQVAFGVAAQLPRLVRAVVALEPALMLRDTSITAAVEPYEWLAWLVETLKSSGSIEEIAARCKSREPNLDDIGAMKMALYVQSIDPGVLACLLNDQSFEHYDWEQVLSRVACSTLLVRGDPSRGGLVRESDVALFTELVPHSTTVQIQNVGHSIIWEQPGTQTLEHIMRFLETL